MYPIQNYRIRFAAVHTIPIGLPVLFVIGGRMYMEGQKEEAGNDEEEVQEIGEGSE